MPLDHPYDMSAGADTIRVRRDYLDRLRDERFEPLYRPWLREAEDAVRAVYHKALAESNYGLLKALIPAYVNLKLLRAKFSPVVIETEPDCWFPEETAEEPTKEPTNE